MSDRLKNRLAQFGPGLLYAGAAIGVSHLVQSTRAGAEFGFQLVAIVIIVNILKYPVFEAGPRYAAATGTTLLEGYKRIGSWAVMVYAIISMLTMFIIMGAISIVTAGLFVQFMGSAIEPQFIAIILMLVSVMILGFGKYTLLDRVMKMIVVLLTLTTIIALAFAIIEPSIKLEEFQNTFKLDSKVHLMFLAALIGWMPAPVDISVWHSVWSVSKMKERGKRINLKTSLLDFNVGYWGTTFLAICFLSLGSLVLYSTGIVLEGGSVHFAGQLVGIYVKNIGQWAYPFIAMAAFATMFSTLLTCLDAFPRTLRKSTKLLLPILSKRKHHQNVYWFWLILTAVGTSIILLFFLSNMRQMVDLATTISFIIAPVLAILNYIAINGSEVSEEARQPRPLKIFNLLSIVLLVSFSVLFLFL